MPAKYNTRKEADKALRDTLHAREHGDWLPATDLTLGDWLTRWLLALEVENLAAGSLRLYKLHARRVSGHIGHVSLQKLTRADVGVLAAKLNTEPGVSGRILSPASRRSVLGVLSHALSDAVKAGHIRTNPAHGVSRPTVHQREMHTWSAEELAAFLQATREDRLGPLWHVLALTGLRRGEALGLRWSDVDFSHGRIALQRQRVSSGYEVCETVTKTGTGRAVDLDADTVAVLRSWKARQASEHLQWGPAWQDSGHIFTREDGAPWHPDRVQKLFQQAVAGVDVPRIRMHDLRHGWATYALRGGVHPKVVQERLGHANIKITLDTYSHVLPDMQGAAASLVAGMIAAAGK